jgi:molybdate transport repressor ModE-like protein
MELGYKIWLESTGRAFGWGPARLLSGVERTGSLRQAAIELGMLYNKAWLIIQAADHRLGFSLLDRSVGGKLGGGSVVTARGQDLLRRYQALEIEAHALLKEMFDRHFSDWVEPAIDDPAS